MISARIKANYGTRGPWDPGPSMQDATRCFIVACRFLGPLVPRFRRVMPLWGGKGFFPDVALRILPHRLAVDQHRYGFAVADAHRQAFTGAPDSYVPSPPESLKHFRALRPHEQPAWTGGRRGSVSRVRAGGGHKKPARPRTPDGEDRRAHGLTPVTA